jgi:hypothetical protein
MTTIFNEWICPVRGICKHRTTQRKEIKPCLRTYMHAYIYIHTYTYIHKYVRLHTSYVERDSKPRLYSSSARNLSSKVIGSFKNSLLISKLLTEVQLLQ